MNPHEKPLILIVSPIPLMPLTGGGIARVWGYVRYLRRQGFRVGIVSVRHRAADAETVRKACDGLWETAPKRRPGQRAAEPRNARARLRQRLARVLPNHVKAPLKRLRDGRAADVLPLSSLDRQRHNALDALAVRVAERERPAAVIAVFAWATRCLDKMPEGTLKIVDTIDVQHKRADAAREAGHNLDRAHCTAEEEVAELRRADILLAIEQEEFSDLCALCPDREVLLAEHAMDVPERPLHGPRDSREVLMVGNLYEPNIIGMQDFIEHSWPGICAREPEARLVICGKMGDRAPQDVPGVSIEGIVPSLDPYYERAAVVINPVPYGTGLKIKTVEALCLGKAVVATRAGIRGLGVNTEAFRVCDVDQMADEVCTLLSYPDQREALETAAHQFALERFAPDHAYAALLQRLREAVSAPA
jgi:glycosyltransferase involved in cell wall biosynthesis